MKISKKNERFYKDLDRSRSLISGQLNVVGNDLGHLAVVVGGDVARNVLARRLHGNIFVFTEIDASMVLAEQLELEPLVARRQTCEVARVTLLLPSRVAASAAASTAATSERITPAIASIAAVSPPTTASAASTTTAPIITANQFINLLFAVFFWENCWFNA
jgi:hypothetical protein